MATCKANSCYTSTNYSWNDYCSYHEKCLEKVQSWIGFFYPILEIETFGTWFNKNCGWVIIKNDSKSSNYPYYIYIIVYEPAVRSMDKNMKSFEYKCGYASLSGARNKAIRIKNKLQNDGFNDIPMLKIHSKAKSYECFSSLIKSPYVIERNLPHRHESGFWSDTFWAPENAENYLKPLDIVWVGRRHASGIPFYHVGIYLGKGNEGKNWICHLDDSKGAVITDWKSFLSAGRCEEIIRHHPVIPFKNYRKIAKQIAWAVDGTPYREGNYSLRNRNCEHFANMIVYGINYSKQVWDNDMSLNVTNGLKLSAAIPTLGLSMLFTGSLETDGTNNGKCSTIKLTNEMNESNDKLGWITDDWSRWIERRCEQEVPTKQNCRIM